MGYAARRNPIAQAAAARAPELGELVNHQRIRELAAHIQTEAQLQHILDQVRPSSIRGMVEAQIRPWCAFTRPPVLGPDGALIMPDQDLTVDKLPVPVVPVVRVTPTDLADADAAVLLEAALSREALQQEIAESIHPAQQPIVTDDRPVCTCRRFGCRAQTGDGPCDGGESFARSLLTR
jgi:porphobilinogen deaminase